ncbi:cation diffusion facilitator family transporter [Pedobacter sp. AW31-3R]|uniref:cation diffusion facilitator family transporter n=1 Tax=Pedobacter sp. AW31-3R TaxID=3445781 RepID=UPI003FA039FA
MEAKHEHDHGSPHHHSPACNHSHDHSPDGHHHSQDGHDHGGLNHVHPVVSNLKLALALNLFFTIIEFVGGAMTNSVAILSDAIHDLGDSIAIGTALWLEKHSLKGRNGAYSYGNRRYSILAATITSVILIAGSVLIVYTSVPRLLHPETVHTEGMFWLAIIGLSFNGFTAWKLSRNGGSLNQKAIMLHLMEDVLGWAAVLLGSLIMYFTKWYWIDPVLSLGIAAYVLYNALKNLGAAGKIFMQAVPARFDENEITAALMKIPMVNNIHDLHVWTMDGEFNVLTTHIVLKSGSDIADMQEVRKLALKILTDHDIQHPTLQIELSGETCKLSSC